MIGALLFLDTLAYVPYAAAFVIFLIAYASRKSQIKCVVKHNKRYLTAFGIFLFLCTINCLLHGLKGIPNMYMQVFMLMIAFSLRRDDAKIFIYLTCMECMVGVYEYYLGVETILPGLDSAEFADEELLYFKRVYGLSTNCSSFSIKILVSTLLLYDLRDVFSNRIKMLLALILFVGIYVTFTRTVIIALMVFGLYLLNKRFKANFIRNAGLGIILLAAVIVGGVIFWNAFGDIISLQFTRGDESSMLTGRPYIWSLFFNFISNHFFFGNGSVHILVPYYSGLIHAHNSFIQLLADHGIILWLYYLIMVFSRINKNNWPYCMPLLVVSLSQYVLFWGFTVDDVFFFAFLCNPFFLKESSKGTLSLKKNSLLNAKPITAD